MPSFLRLFLILLSLGPACAAQELTVRVINVTNGRPLPGQAVTVSYLYNKNYDKSIPPNHAAALNLVTDLNGQAHFRLPELPPAHFSAQVRGDWSHWHCGCVVLGSTDELIAKGMMGRPAPASHSGEFADLRPAPGEILFLARPMSFFERLLYPVLKE